MSGRTRQSLAASQGEEAAPYIPGLVYNQPLSWRAGKPIPVAELLERLQKLHNELRKIEQHQDQEGPKAEDYTRAAQDLANQNLLAHKDKGVRALTCCCLMDVMRICAPNAPLKLGQIKDIFTTIVNSIIPALADPSNAYNTQHVYILNSLAEVKSIVLITDIPNPDSLILNLFTSCFDIVSGSAKASTGEEIRTSVVHDMTRVLVAVIDEAPTLQPDIVDVVLRQFLRIDPRMSDNETGKGKQGIAAPDGKQGTFALKEYPPAYNLSKALCADCPEKMTTYISVYFSNVMMDASASIPSNGQPKNPNRRISSLDESDDETEGTLQLTKAHKLIRELWRACPDVLQNVIGYLETELTTESVSLRLLATQTLGDIISGIGVAGPPPAIPTDPAAYPPVTNLRSKQDVISTNPLQTPMSPKPFSQAHSSAYDLFLSRKQDKSPSVRAAWATASGRILFTLAGGIGLEEKQEQHLVKGLAQMLGDVDEKVRVSAIKAVGAFGLANVVNRLAVDGGVSTEGTVLCTVADRVKDKKQVPRDEATRLLGRLWGAAAGEIEHGVEEVVSAISGIPQKIFEAYYTGDTEIHALIDTVLLEDFLPIGYPPIKSKSSRANNQRARGKVTVDNDQADSVDPDGIRVRRILTLVRCLEGKARSVFFALQQRQVSLSKGVQLYLETCDKFNGGVVDGDEAKIKAQLTKVCEILARGTPEPSRVTGDLWKFAKLHDRRAYHLVKCTLDPSNDYRTVVNAIKELTKRLENGPHSTAVLLETLRPLIYRCGLLVYNRSHIPAIIELSRTDDEGLATTAHDVLKDISSRNPEILKSHVKEMCSDLQSNVPSQTQEEHLSAADTLKACSGFATKFPDEISKDRKFMLTLNDYALYSTSPRAAKHAVSILLAISPKKELHAKDLMQKALKGCQMGEQYFLTRLSTISQLCRLAPSAAAEDAEADKIIEVALNSVLLHNQHPAPLEDKIDPEDAPYMWSSDVDPETTSKQLALKILVNRACSQPDNQENKNAFFEVADPVIRILSSLITNNGELQKSYSTPATQKPHLRLAAAKYLLKLCTQNRAFEDLVTADLFNKVALVAHDRLSEVRTGFVQQLKKYLGANKLSHRWYSIPYLLAFEPDATLRTSTMLWLKSRTLYFAKQQQIRIQQATNTADKERIRANQNVMELMLARLLSLLAHHPDYPIQGTDSYVPDLVDYARYIIFYLSATSNEDNLSLIFHVAQRVKQAQDGICAGVEEQDEISQRLYTLSDLAQMTIRIFADVHGHQKGHSVGINLLQTWPGKARLPAHLFKALPNHEASIQIAEQTFLPTDEGFGDELEKLVRGMLKSGSTKSGHKKRKAEVKQEADDAGDEPRTTKKSKKFTSMPIRKAPSAKSIKTPKPGKKRKSEDSDIDDGSKTRSGEPSRKSARKSVGKATQISYAEADSSEDDREMEEMQNEAREDIESASASEPENQQISHQVNGDNEAQVSEGDENVDEANVGQQEGSDEMEVDQSPSPLARTARSKKGVLKNNSAPHVNGAQRNKKSKSAYASSNEKTAKAPPRGQRKGTPPGKKNAKADTQASTRQTRARTRN
ncbi:MAG: hypothetical protein Q9227_007818 [Pyrenula ochraceoflavens]